MKKIISIILIAVMMIMSVCVCEENVNPITLEDGYSITPDGRFIFQNKAERITTSKGNIISITNIEWDHTTYYKNRFSIGFNIEGEIIERNYTDNKNIHIYYQLLNSEKRIIQDDYISIEVKYLITGDKFIGNSRSLDFNIDLKYNETYTINIWKIED